MKTSTSTTVKAHRIVSALREIALRKQQISSHISAGRKIAELKVNKKRLVKAL